MNTDLRDIYKILITLLALSLIALLSSCGVRKVEQSTTKQETKTEKNTINKSDVLTEKQTNVIINDLSNEIEVTPIDTSKVLVINGKAFKNAKVKFTAKKIITTIAEKTTVKDKSIIDTRVKNSSKNVTKVKNTDRKSNPFAPLLWLLIPATVYALWKYKFKIFVP